MKRLTLIFIVSLLISLLFVNCKKSEKSPAEDVTKKSGEVGESTDAQDMLLTEKEVQNFIKAFPAFKTESEKLGKKFAGSDKNVLKAMRTSSQAVKSVKKLDKMLKPYGFTMDTFFETYAKIMSSYGMMALGGPGKFYDAQIEQMKQVLKSPNLPEESKKEMEESIKELEETKNSDETKILGKNVKILEKYKDDLKGLFD